MPILSMLWRTLGIKGVALIAIAGIAGVLWVRLHITEAELSGKAGQLAAQQAAQVSQLHSITKLQDANAQATKLLAEYRADLSYSKHVAAGLAAQNATLATQTVSRQQQVSAGSAGNACAPQPVPPAIVGAVCGTSGCH